MLRLAFVAGGRQWRGAGVWLSELEAADAAAPSATASAHMWDSAGGGPRPPDIGGAGRPGRALPISREPTLVIIETVEWTYLRKTCETAAYQLHRGLRAGRGAHMGLGHCI